MATKNGDTVAKGIDKKWESSLDRRQVEHPGSMASKLEGELYVREMITAFKRAGVYDAAEGRPDPREYEYIDHPVPQVPSDPSDPNYFRLSQWHAKATRDNLVNEQKRRTIRLEAVTTVYGMCHASCKDTNRKLAFQMQSVCAWQGEYSNYMDGETAWAMIIDSLNLGQRSWSDAKATEFMHTLFNSYRGRDGMLPREFTNEIHAYQVNVLPHLERKPNPEGTSMEIIAPLPKTLTEAGRRVEDRARALVAARRRGRPPALLLAPITARGGGGRARAFHRRVAKRRHLEGG